MSDLSNNLFLKTIQNKGDNSLNLVKNLILNNKEIINIPFTITIDNNKITHSPLTYSILKKYSKIAIFLIEKGGAYCMQKWFRRSCRKIIRKSKIKY